MNSPYRKDHNLLELYMGLAPRDRKKIDKKYKAISQSSAGLALDV